MKTARVDGGKRKKGSKGTKDCHIGIGKTRNYGRCTGRSKTVFFEGQGIAVGAREPASLVGGNHLLARLVHQGSDPTLPYQALVIRESAKLFLGFNPLGQ
jgi:hypothetical protein